MFILVLYYFFDEMIKNLLNLFFPKVCLGCDGQLTDNELYVCTACRHKLPLTNFHFSNDEMFKNRLYGRVQLQQATALLFFAKKGIVQQLMHNLKYRGHQEVGTFLGKWLGEELKELEVYRDIDAVIPVPLHKRKLRKRGYNQVTTFGQEIAAALEVPFYDNILVKVRDVKTQVFKDRLKRTDVNTVFKVSDFETLKGKHVLLVDDIITTGATIESCANVLIQIEGLKLSVATMAITI